MFSCFKVTRRFGRSYSTPLISNASFTGYTRDDLDWEHISTLKCITHKAIENNLDKPWNWKKLSSIVYIETVKSFPDKNWDWEILTGNNRILASDILQNSSLPWNWNVLTRRIIDYAAISGMHIINDYHTLPWDWKYVSTNEYAVFDIVKRYPSKQWDWDILSANKGININDILENPDFPWNWRIISLRQFNE